MGRTFLTGGQVKDGSVQKVDLDTTTTGQAVITKVIAGTNISISSTGVDAGTGDVTVNLGGTVASDISSLQSSVSGKADSSSLATVATSGSYNDLTNKPSLFDGAYSSLTGTPSLATVATSGSYNDLTNKPSLFSGSYADLTNKPSIPSTLDDLSDVTISSPSNTQVLQYNGSAWVNATVSGGASSLDELSDVAITSASKGQFVVHNGTSFVNSNTIEASGAAVKPLIVKGAVSQTANLFEAQNSAGTAVVSFTNAGAASFSSNITTTGSINFGPTGILTLTSNGNYNGVALGRSASTGESGLALGSYMAAGSNSMMMGWGGGGLGRIIYGLSSGEVGIGVSSPGAQLHAQPKSASMKGLIVQGVASQTANLVEVNTSTNELLFGVLSNGTVKMGTSGSATSTVFGHNAGAFRIESQGTESCFSVVSPDNGSGKTTFNLTRVPADAKWNMSTGSIGLNFVTGAFSWTGVGIDLPSGTGPGAKLHINCDLATKKGQLIKAHASQSESLFEVQNSSGTAMTLIQSNGTLHAKRYTQTVSNAFNTSLAPSSGTLTVDTSLGNVTLGALSASVTTWAFTNVPTENSKMASVTVIIDGNTSYTYGDACSVNGTAVTNGIMWAGGSAPTATDNYDIIKFDIVKDSAGTINVFGYGSMNFS